MRSQIAEAVARWYGGPHVEAFSAGVNPAAAVHPRLAQLMGEIGIPAAGAVPTSLRHRPMAAYDVVVTLCDPERATCPVPPAGPRHISWVIPGPGPGEAAPEALRGLRDAIVARVRALVDELAAGDGPDPARDVRPAPSSPGPA